MQSVEVEGRNRVIEVKDALVHHIDKPNNRKGDVVTKGQMWKNRAIAYCLGFATASGAGVYAGYAIARGASNSVSNNTAAVSDVGSQGYTRMLDGAPASTVVTVAGELPVCPTVLTDPIDIGAQTVSKATNDLNRGLFPAGADLGTSLDALWINHFAEDNHGLDASKTNGAKVVLRQLVTIDGCTVG